MLAKFSYRRTVSIKEATAAAAQPETRILAGGTDLLGCLRDGVFQANRLVSINAIKDLQGIRPRPGGGLRIGALTTLTDIAANRQILDTYPVLAQAAAAVGSAVASAKARRRHRRANLRCMVCSCRLVTSPRWCRASAGSAVRP